MVRSNGRELGSILDHQCVKAIYWKGWESHEATQDFSFKWGGKCSKYDIIVHRVQTHLGDINIDVLIWIACSIILVHGESFSSWRVTRPPWFHPQTSVRASPYDSWGMHCVWSRLNPCAFGFKRTTNKWWEAYWWWLCTLEWDFLIGFLVWALRINASSANFYLIFSFS